MISDVQQSSSWINVYDDRGKVTATMSASGKEVCGIAADFFVCNEGSWIKTYDQNGKQIAVMSASGKIVRGAAGTSFTTKEGS